MPKCEIGLTSEMATAGIDGWNIQQVGETTRFLNIKKGSSYWCTCQVEDDVFLMKSEGQNGSFGKKNGKI